mmetsp:Transcript_22049/g.61347  ORF Transcript_22049/g.61347 Transcript_22049/m.61347 type:complete len:91 (-) Transcript_22049:513-785(-)
MSQQLSLPSLNDQCPMIDCPPCDEHQRDNNQQNQHNSNQEQQQNQHRTCLSTSLAPNKHQSQRSYLQYDEPTIASTVPEQPESNDWLSTA